jgi:hypothetical protein
MNSASEPEQVPQFAFRIVETSGENVWYVVIVKPELMESIGWEIASAANALQPGSSVVERVDSPIAFERAVHDSTCRIWIGFGFEQFDHEEWSKIDRDRSRLERLPGQTIGVDSSIAVLVLSKESFGALQSSAPDLTSWIGGSVFELAPEAALSSTDREVRLAELRRWGNMTDDEVVRGATDGSLPSDPYFAEWLVLLGRGDLLGNG